VRALLSCLLLLTIPAAAAEVEVEREEYRIIGWNNACTVAVERYAYPMFGQAIHGEPISTRVGTMAIVTAQPVVETRWVFQADGVNTYDKVGVAGFRKKLRKAGYDRPGFAETIRNAPAADTAGAAEVILSTAILEARPDFWPDTREWRLGWIHYNPLTTCALLVYDKIGERARFKFLLTRIYNPSSRSERGRAHTTNARGLFNNGELAAALAEAEIGAGTAPEVGGTRYQHAAMLVLSGRLNKAMEELQAAIKLDERFIAKAADDLDFESLHVRQDFRGLIFKEKLKKAPPPP